VSAPFDAEFQGATKRAALLSAELSRPVAVLRDITGRCSVLVDDRVPLAAVPTGADLLFASELFAPEDMLDRRLLRMISVEGRDVPVIEQQATGDGWTSLPIEGSDRDTGNAVALYSFKGGVGRTTTTTLLAWQLAKRGKKVLVVDLDLESPGLGELLLPAGRQPGRLGRPVAWSLL